MRVIKFEFLYKGLPFSSKSDKFNWHKKYYTLGQLIKTPLSKLSDVHSICELVAKRQFTGLQDKNGVDIYDGDVISIDYIGTNSTHKYQPKQVKWDSEKCGFNVSKGIECEIIGNIHENPELIS